MITVADLDKIIRRFSFQALCKTAIFLFPETTLPMIKKKYKGLTKIIVIKEMLLIAESLPEEELNSRCSKLTLLAVDEMRSKNWYVWRLKLLKPSTERRDCVFRLKEYLVQQLVDADLEMIPLPKKYLLRVTKHTTKRGEIKTQAPIVFQYFFNKPYLFCGRKFVENDIMRAVVGSLGYDLFKQSGLYGANVLKLLRMMQCKKDANTTAQEELLVPEPGTSCKIIRTTPIAHVQYFGNESYTEKIAEVQETVGANLSQSDSAVPAHLQKFLNMPVDKRVVVQSVSQLMIAPHLQPVLNESINAKEIVQLLPCREGEVQATIGNNQSQLESTEPAASSNLQPFSNESTDQNTIGSNQPQLEKPGTLASSDLEQFANESTEQKVAVQFVRHTEAEIQDTIGPTNLN